MARKGRLQVELDLAGAVYVIFDTYIDFITTPVPAEQRGDSKAFTNWQGAGRSALAHIEQLDRIAGLLGSEAQQETVGTILAEARRSLAAEAPEEKEDPDGDAGGDA